MGAITLFRQDAFSLLESLESGSVDAAITDPPYGTTDIFWDKAPDWERLFAELFRVLRPHGTLVMFSAQPLASELIRLNRKAFRYELIWQKTTPVGILDSGKRPLRSHENMLVFIRQYRGAGNKLLSVYNPQKWQGLPVKASARSIEGGRIGHYKSVRHTRVTEDLQKGLRHPTSVLTFANRHGGKSWHPTAKPVELLRWLVRTYSNPGQLVLDPFFGAGSAALACASEGRRFVGSELHLPYVETAASRLASDCPGADVSVRLLG